MKIRTLTEVRIFIGRGKARSSIPGVPQAGPLFIYMDTPDNRHGTFTIPITMKIPALFPSLCESLKPCFFRLRPTQRFPVCPHPARTLLPMRTALLTLIAGLLPVFAAPAEITHVLHITVDGLRGDTLRNALDAAPADFPAFRKLRTGGAATFEARCDFDYSETIPNHTAVVTGRPVIDPPGQTGVAHGYTANGYTGTATSGDTVHKLGTAAYVYRAGTFDMAHDRGFSTALFGGKTRLNLFVNSYNATNGAPDLTGPDNGRNKIDFSTAADLAGATLVNIQNAVVSQINGNTLRNYSLVHFTDTDTGTSGGGHTIGWESSAWILSGVRVVDGYLSAIFNAIEASPGLRGKVAIVLTADHGGGGGGTGPGSTPDRNHGDASSAKNFTIPVCLWGPGIPAGVDAYSLFRNRRNPGTARPDASAITVQPLRNADTGNIALTLLGARPVTGSWFRPEMAAAPDISTGSGTVTVSWPLYLTGYRLESSSDLTDSSWAPVAATPVEAAGTRQVTLPAAGAQRFWRLRQPD